MNISQYERISAQNYGEQKLVIIMRGLPGSGKSHWVNALLEKLSADQKRRVLQQGYFSTDSFFYHGSDYRFDATKLAEYHQRNLTAFIQALTQKEPVVICDNTNLSLWELMPYKAISEALDYRVEIVLIGEPQNIMHQQLCARRNQHAIDIKQIISMAHRFESLDADFMDS